MYVFMCLLVIYVPSSAELCKTLLPIITIYCNILPDPLSVRNLLLQLLRMLPAVSFQLSILSGIASVTQSCHPKDMPLRGVAHLQVVHTGPHDWMMQKYEGLLVILSQLWSINLVPELCMKSAKAVIKLFQCSTPPFVQCYFVALTPTRVDNTKGIL